jgi:hypothetical protein
MWRNGGDILFRVSEYNIVMEHFSVATISKVHFEVMEQPNPNRVAKTEMECRCNGPLLTIFCESRQAHNILYMTTWMWDESG